MVRRGGRKRRKVENESDLDAATLAWKKDYAVFLKASDHSYRYISDVLGVTTRMVRGWFEDEPMKKKVLEVQADMIDGALKLLKRYSVEAVEILMDVARRARDTSDWSEAIRAVEAVLDRAGLAKVNKSESQVVRTDRHETDISATMFDKLESLPVETQSKLAELAAEMERVVGEAKGAE